MSRNQPDPVDHHIYIPYIEHKVQITGLYDWFDWFSIFNDGDFQAYSRHRNNLIISVIIHQITKIITYS